MESRWKETILLNSKTYWLETTTMVVATHNSENQEFRQLRDYAPCGRHWGPSAVFSWLLGCLEGSQQLQWHAGCRGGDSWKLVTAGPLLLSMSSQSLPTCLSSRVIRLLTPWLRVLRPRVPKGWKQKLPNHLKARTRTNMAPLPWCSIGESGHKPAQVHKQRRKSPLLNGGMSESLQSSYIISRCRHTRNWGQGQVKIKALA